MKTIEDNSEKKFLVKLENGKNVEVMENSARRASYSGFKRLAIENDLVAESKEDANTKKFFVNDVLENNEFEYYGKAWYTYSSHNSPDWMPEKVVDYIVRKQPTL